MLIIDKCEQEFSTEIDEKILLAVQYKWNLYVFKQLVAYFDYAAYLCLLTSNEEEQCNFIQCHFRRIGVYFEKLRIDYLWREYHLEFRLTMSLSVLMVISFMLTVTWHSCLAEQT